MSMPPQMPQGPPPPMPPEPPRRKGLHPLARAGIGCGALLAIAIVLGAFAWGWAMRKFEEVKKDFEKDPARTVAERVIAMNPELEIVRENEESGEVTIRNVKTGEETTVNWSEIREGRFSMTGPDGEEMKVGAADLSEVPAWVPRYAGVTPVVYQMDKGGELNGVLTYSTADDVEEVVGFYEGELDAFSSRSSSNLTINNVRKETRKYSDGGRSVELVVSRDGAAAETQVVVTYSEKGGP